MLKKITSIVTIIAALSANVLTAHAFTLVDIQTEENFEITKHSYDDNWVEYCVNGSANVKVGIYEAVSASNSKELEILTEKAHTSGCYKEKWLGSEKNNYFYAIEAVSTDLWVPGSDYKSDWLNGSSSYSGDLKITDVEVENHIFDPWDSEEAEINFSINKDAYVTLKIYDDYNDRIVTLVDDVLYKDGDHTIDWDGEDKYGDIVQEGEYTYELEVENSDDSDFESGTIYVSEDGGTSGSTEDPRLKNVFASKSTFDPGRKETTHIVFKLTAEADVKVTIYEKDGTKHDVIFDEDDLEEGIYAVEWDGEDADEDEKYYEYKVYAKNKKGTATEEGKIYVKEDDNSNKKPNIYRDSVDKYPYNPEEETLKFKFTVDRDAEMTLQIKDGSKVEAEVVEDEDVQEGTYTFSWDGRDKYGDYVADGVYTYKLTAKNNKGKDIEEGQFYVDDSTKAANPYSSCGSFTDVNKNHKYCSAIKWAKSNDIFEGYSNGAFGPDQPINRVEALKVILENFNIKQSNHNHSYFTDTYSHAWYAPYLNSAVSLGIVQGYPDGSFKPSQYVNRIEGLTMLLNTGKTKGLIVPSNNYGYPYYDVSGQADTKWFLSYAWMAQSYDLTDNEYYLFPGDYLTRAEMADMLYRYHKQGLKK